MTHALSLILATFLFAACACGADAVLAVDTDYQVTAINGKPVTGIEGFNTPTLLLDSKEQRVSGTSGVNRYGGSFTMAAGTLTCGQMMSTMMASSEPAMAAEMEFLRVIQSALTIQTDDKGVTLTGKAGTLRLAKSAKAPNANP